MSGRLLVVSHACVIPENQAVYARLRELGWDVTLVTPRTWRHEYATDAFASTPAPGLEESFHTFPVLLRGRPQRHVYRCRATRVLRRFAPDVVFLEEESFSIPALQFGRACHRLGIPFGVQAAENLDRKLPAPARWIRSHLLSRAGFVAARSPAAAELARRHDARGVVGVAPHAVPGWPRTERRTNGSFTVGYAGRLVQEKGVRDLVHALRRVNGKTRLLLVGDGDLRPELEGADGLDIHVQRGVTHGEMPGAYAAMDVLVLPSRTTPRWAEQFGRVLVEALWSGVPVIGSDSGEIPWVIETTRGGIVYPEGDVNALAAAISSLRDDGERRAELARNGRARVEELFAVEPAAAALDDLLQQAVEGCR